MLAIFRKRYQHLNTIYISKSALIQNHHLLQNSNPQALLCPVLKSNAYGHGLKIVVPIFDSLKSAFLCVDSLYEAYELQKVGVKSSVLILGYTLPENYIVKRIPFHLPLFDLETAEILNKYQKGINVHLKIDTGMNRFGIKLKNLDSFLDKLTQFKHIRVAGAFTHLANADTADNELNGLQVKRFKEALKVMECHNIYPKWKHIAASSGSLIIKDSDFNMLRIGLSSYGIAPESISSESGLKPALEFRSRICQIKIIERGESVSYGGTFTAKQKMLIGVIGAGYFEGIDRRLSNKGFVTVGKTQCQILGKVCMNITMVDLGKVENPYVGQECIVYSSDPQAINSINNSAKICDTIPYELLVKLNGSVKRQIIY